MLGAARCVMAMDVDGVLDERGAVIKVLGEESEAETIAPRARTRPGGSRSRSGRP